MKKYVRFKIWLETPYKWGSGYGNATSREVALNKEALRDITEKIGFVKDDLNDSDLVYYNKLDGFEELYMHPMEISGVIAEDKYDELVRIIKEGNYEVTKYVSDKVIREAKMYTFEEIAKFAATLDYKTIKQVLPQYAKWGVPCNYEFREFGFYFKEYTFAHTQQNAKTNEQKNFLVSLVNEIIQKGKK